MSATDHLSSDQFRNMTFTTKQIGRMRSNDFAVRMKEVGPLSVGRTRDKSKMLPHELAADMKANGVNEKVRAGFGWNGATLINGHHRYVAANIAGITKLPGEVHKEDYQDMVHWKAKYTPPGQDYTYKGYKHRNEK